MNKIFTVSAAPHLKEGYSVPFVMWQVAAALLPALVVSIILFGINALLLTLWSVIGAVVTETLIKVMRKKPVVIQDGSAVVTGMLVAFNIHAASPWWLPIVGSVFAIAVGKEIFGGIGHNPFNPALLGRVFLVASWPTLTTAGWVRTGFNSINGLTQNLSYSQAAQDLISSATPLGLAKQLRDPAVISTLQNGEANLIFNELASFQTVQTAFLGNIGGCIGEVSALALLLGAAWLAYKRIIEWRIPISFIGTVFILTFIFGGINGLFSASILLPFFHVVTGGLILGAFFMATDMVTSPITKKGRIYFGIGCGILTVVIRLIGGYPEGVSYSILLMNIAVPLIDRYTIPKPFGEA